MKIKINKTLFLAFFILIQIALFVGGLSLIHGFSLKNKIIHNELVAWQNKDQDARLLQVDYQDNKQAIDLLNQALPANDQIISFFEELENIASNSGTVITLSMSSLPAKDENQKTETYVLKLSIRGTLPQIINFLEKIELYDQLIIVRQLVFDSPGGLSNELVGSILIKTFFAL